MTKKKYVRPIMVGERFVADEYIAACGDSGTTYKFVCNASKQYGFFDGGDVYLETNRREGLQEGEDEYLGPYIQCSEPHIAESTDDFFDGYFVPYGIIDNRVRQVVIWRGENNDNIHCTTTLDKSDWETAKS